MTVASLFLVERINTSLKAHGVPDDLAYEVVAILPKQELADAYAAKCRNLDKVRAIRVRRTFMSTYGMPVEEARKLIDIMPEKH